MALTKVSTDGVKDDAITSGKIPANAVGTSELADNAVTAGKTSGVQTTINNNSNNRIITGSNTSNSLEGEANLTYNGQLLQATNSHINISSGYSYQWSDSHERIGQSDGKIQFFTNNSEKMTLSGSNLGIGTNNPATQLEVKDSTDTRITITAGNAISQAGINFADNSGVDGICTYDHNTRKLHLGAGTSSFTDGDLTIDSSGRVMIGTTTEGFGTADDLTIASSADTGITIRSGTSNQGNIFFSDGTSGTDEFRGIIQYTHGSGTGEHLRLFVQSAEKVRLDSDGLKLNGDTAAANALDDYEEGTYTPTPNSGTASNNDGQYTKIGNFCCVTGSIDFDNNGTSGQMVQISLPFTAGSGRAGSGVIRYSNASIADTITIHVNGGHASMDWYQFGGSGFTYGEAGGNRYDFVITYRTV